jgi:hypothetical protein
MGGGRSAGAQIPSSPDKSRGTRSEASERVPSAGGEKGLDHAHGVFAGEKNSLLAQF